MLTTNGIMQKVFEDREANITRLLNVEGLDYYSTLKRESIKSKIDTLQSLINYFERETR